MTNIRSWFPFLVIRLASSRLAFYSYVPFVTDPMKVYKFDKNGLNLDESNLKTLLVETKSRLVFKFDMPVIKVTFMRHEINKNDFRQINLIY